MDIIDTIESALTSIIGLTLTGTTRAGDMECIKFGVKMVHDSESGEQINIGECAIHLQCTWRIITKRAIWVGSDNLYDHPNSKAGFVPNWTWDGQLSARDVLLGAYIRTSTPVISKVAADNYGGFELFFEDNSILQVFPTKSLHGKYEHWRLLNNQSDAEHFVVDNDFMNQIN